MGADTQLRTLERSYRREPCRETAGPLLRYRARWGLMTERQRVFRERLRAPSEHPELPAPSWEALLQYWGQRSPNQSLPTQHFYSDGNSTLVLGIREWLLRYAEFGLRTLAQVCALAVKEQPYSWRDALLTPMSSYDTRMAQYEYERWDDDWLRTCPDYEYALEEVCYDCQHLMCICSGFFQYSAPGNQDEVVAQSRDGHHWQILIPGDSGIDHDLEIYERLLTLNESDPPMTKLNALEAWIDRPEASTHTALLRALGRHHRPGDEPGDGPFEYIDDYLDPLYLSYISVQEALSCVFAGEERQADCATRAVYYAFLNDPAKLEDFCQGLHERLMDWSLSDSDFL